MEKITFVIPSRNNLEFLKLAHASIRGLKTIHEILVLNDGSSDGTFEWIEETRKTDKSLTAHHNLDTSKRVGIVGMFDRGIEMSKTDVIMAFHADMVASPNLDEHILKNLKRGTVVTATRVEPPLHPPGPEKIIENFGLEAEEFNFDVWNEWCSNIDNGERVTEGIFAPWCMYKEDFLAIGGHDELFAPQSREDSDLFARFHLNGYKFIQPWSAVVYHFTSRGSRFNKYAGGGTGINSQEWINTNRKNERNFVRKWGTFPAHDKLMKPIVFPKYNIGIVIKNCTNDQLELLEPWSSAIYTDAEWMKYITIEQSKTNINLKEKIFSIHSDVKNNIEVRLDGTSFTEQDFNYIKALPQIIKESGEIGTFKIGNLEITINSLESYENSLIINKEKKNAKN